MEFELKANTVTGGRVENVERMNFFLFKWKKWRISRRRSNRLRQHSRHWAHESFNIRMSGEVRL